MSVPKLGGSSQFSGILIVLTVSADQFADFVHFECPCNRSINLVYALVYLLGPSITLFFLALLKQQMFWRLVTGACNRASGKENELLSDSSGITRLQGFVHLMKVICIATPAAVVWYLICMLKGNVYSCAFWPDADVPCDNETFYVEPCKAPETVDAELSTCDHLMNRDLHAQSHMIAWLGICSFGFLGVVALVMKKALSKHGYLQTKWIGEYRKAEYDAFKRKIKLRANDLGSELVNEFLREERDDDEWNTVSKISAPKKDKYGNVLLSPLAAWADKEADTLFAGKTNPATGKKFSPKDQSAFYFLTEDEMTFNKERNPPPPVTEHHVKFFAEGDFAKQMVAAVAASEKK